MWHYILWGIAIYIAVMLAVALFGTFFKKKESVEQEEESALDIPIDPKELLEIQIAKSINGSGLVRSTLRRLIASEIKARVSDTALDPNAFLPSESWDYNRSKRELLEDQLRFEREGTVEERLEKERQRMIGTVRQILQENNISEDWILQNGREATTTRMIQGPCNTLNNFTSTSFGHSLECKSLEAASHLELDRLISRKADILRFKRENDSWKAKLSAESLHEQK